MNKFSESQAKYTIGIHIHGNRVIIMVLKINRFHVFVFLVGLLSVLLIFAVKAETSKKAVSGEGLSLPVVMYHHVTTNRNRAGKYVVLQEELRRDLDYIRSMGYETVNVQDLIDYVDGKKQLPEKVIMITFDDGFESTYTLAWPLFSERKMKAVVSPIGSVTELYTENGDRNINYAYMGWHELSEINKSEEFEVQNHTYDMHYNESGKRHGLAKMNSESEEEYKAALKADLSKMQTLLKENSAIQATAAVYPYGNYSKNTLSVVKALGFRCSMVCEERINRIQPGNPESLYNLGRFNRPSGKSTESFFARLLES